MKKFTGSLLIGILALSGLFVIQSCGAKTNDDISTGESSNTDSSTEKSTNTDSSNLVEFHSKTVKGSSLTKEDLQGKVVLVNYWGTWCPPCKAEIPHFQEVYEQYKDDGFVIVAIALPQGTPDKTIGDKGDVLDFMEKQPMTFPVIMKDEAPHKELQNRYGTINAVPTSFLFDQKGNHVQTFRGAMEKKDLLENVPPLLSQK